MKKLILLTLLSFGIYSCDTTYTTPNSLPNCTFDYNNTTVWLANNELLFPPVSDLPTAYQNQIYGNGIFDAFKDGDVSFYSNRAYAIINYHASTYCTGEATKLYRPEDTSYGYTTFNEYPTSEDVTGEYTGLMKSDVWNYYGSCSSCYYTYIVWEATESIASGYIDFGIGIQVLSSYNSNGRMQSQQKLIINDSKNYIYSGGARTTI